MKTNKKIVLKLDQSEYDVLMTANQGFRVTNGLIRLVGEIVVDAMRREEECH